ncbi:hypothetical protein M3P21_14420 [Ruegeria sp. 2012CJ41-6]|uniref:Uncharacterized protein n=1 Tax=Ruegeria spongiae TaxID=2942209 RepID=A0ABT0Q6C9_9RHOB|nr:hypothetical protein [Ruegeria spongiae]MCL6284728.1 hypothetical protein [Ruegeria spongiae]
MAKPRITVETDIVAKAPITLLAHAAMQKMRKGKSGVLFGKHRPDWKLINASIEWDMDKKTKSPTGVSAFVIKVRYSGQIYISKAIDKNSKCFKLVKEHEQEHQKICIAGTKAATGACRKILKKHFDAVLRSYKGDIKKLSANEATAVKKIAFGAFKEMDDGPYFKVAVKSLKIDTDSHYSKISPHCAEYG